MPGRSGSEFSLSAYRDIKPVSDEPECWQINGPRPEFELQTAARIQPQGWVAISFVTSAEGIEAHHYILTVNSGDPKQRILLGPRRHLTAVVSLDPEVRWIRLSLIGAAGRVRIRPHALRPLNKREAHLRILAGIIGGRNVGWRRLATEAKSAREVLKRKGPSALINWLIRLYLYAPDFDLPTPSVSPNFDLFNDADVSEALCLKREQLLWSPQPANDINDLWSAARFCIDILRSRGDLRERFPHALSAGHSGGFACWFNIEGPDLFHLTAGALNVIKDVFKADLANHVRQLCLTSDELRAQFPFAFTPAGQREFFYWLLHGGRELLGLRLETIWWFFLESAEDPSAELARTYLFTPQWQTLFPDGLTVFSRAKMAAWLISAYQLSGKWVEPSTWPMIGTSTEHLRLAYALRADWQRKHPRPFDTFEAAQAFLVWLTTPESGLTGEPLAWCAGLEKQTVARELTVGGINIVGHFCYPSGLRTSVESLTEGAKQVGLGVTLRDVWTEFGDDPRHAKFNGLECYDTTLIHTQPEPYFGVCYARSGLQPRNSRTYRIGYWYWELDDNIPAQWMRWAAQVDELWVATKFIAAAMRKHFDVPIRQMMPGLELPSFPLRPRSYFKLPEGRFIFLFVFHALSTMERKNPLGLIQAYRRAFEDDDRVLLVVKTAFGEKHPDLMAELHAASAGAHITVIDAIFTQEETLSLMAAADCYVSLHRSEGWGLTMAESMLLGRPVIATGYSGNMDFMVSSNSLLVDHEIVTLERAYPPYVAGAHWANPSVDHAARLMRQVFENQTWARDLGAKAKLDLRERMSLRASGKRIAARLAEIQAAQRSKRDS